MTMEAMAALQSRIIRLRNERREDPNAVCHCGSVYQAYTDPNGRCWDCGGIPAEPPRVELCDATLATGIGPNGPMFSYQCSLTRGHHDRHEAWGNDEEPLVTWRNRGGEDL